MSELTERLNIVAGDISSESPFTVIVANKKNMVVSDFVSAIDDFFSVEEFSEQELYAVANVIMDFSSAEELPFGGEISIWFDANTKEASK